MKRRFLPTCDWQASMTRADRHRDWLGWAGAATSVAAMLVATTAIAMQLEADEGLKDATENALLIDMEPSAPSPPALALSAPAPDVPQVEAPEEQELVEETPEPPPEPVAEEEPLPEPEEIAEIPEVTPDEVALPDTPPPPPPTVKPRERPERVAEPKPEPEPKREPRREAAAPPASQQREAAPSRTQGTTRAPVSAGQVQNLRAQWGGAIRNRIERRMGNAARRARGQVTLRLSLTREGGLLGASIQGSSGDAQLDAAALRAVNSVGSFPAAPAGLTDQTYSFSLPLQFQ